MPARAALLATLVAIVWGLNFVVIAVGVEDFPPTLFVAVRFVAVILPAIFFVPKPKARWRDIALVGVFMSVGQFGLLYTSITLGMPPGLASLVLQAQVALTIVFAALALRERPSVWQSVGVTLGAVGLVVVGSGRHAHVPLLAFFVCLAAAASWAIGNVIVRQLGRTAPHGSPLTSGLSMTVWSALFVPAPLIILSFVFDGPAAVADALTSFTLPQVLSTLYTAWLASLFGYGVWNTLLARYPASAVVPFTMLVPVVGMTGAWLALGEVPSSGEVVGGVMLLAGVAIALRPPRRPQPGMGLARTRAPDPRRQ